MAVNSHFARVITLVSHLLGNVSGNSGMSNSIHKEGRSFSIDFSDVEAGGFAVRGGEFLGRLSGQGLI